MPHNVNYENIHLDTVKPYCKYIDEANPHDINSISLLFGFI